MSETDNLDHGRSGGALFSHLARGPPTDCGELVQMHDARAVLPATDRRAARQSGHACGSALGRPLLRERRSLGFCRHLSVFWGFQRGSPVRPRVSSRAEICARTKSLRCLARGATISWSKCLAPAGVPQPRESEQRFAAVRRLCWPDRGEGSHPASCGEWLVGSGSKVSRALVGCRFAINRVTREFCPVCDRLGGTSNCHGRFAEVLENPLVAGSYSELRDRRARTDDSLI